LGGGLNASLRQRYQQMSQGKKQAQSNEADDSQSAVALFGEVTGAVTAAHEDTLNKDITTNAPTKEAAGKRGKKRKRVLRRASSSNLNNSADYGEEGDLSFLTPVPRPTERYHDLGGIDHLIQEVRQLVEYPLVRPELYRHLGIEPPRGVLLRGPPGTGKSHLATAVAGELGVPFFCVSAPALVTGVSGESEGRVRQLFQAASETAPAIIFLDELDAVAAKRSDTGRGMEQRIVAQLLTCLDQIAPTKNRNQAAVIVLAATNRPDALDPALRRAGRFDKEILLGVPDEVARRHILQSMTRTMRLADDVDLALLAKQTPGYVGADVRSLCKEAAVVAMNRIFSQVLKDTRRGSPLSKTMNSSGLDDKGDVGALEDFDVSKIVPLTDAQMDPLYVTMDDFKSALPMVQPSSKREGFATVPDVTWKDIGALHEIREELTLSVLEPIRSPEKFRQLGLSIPTGVLLYGPPGCGKTLLAKAVANESGANFISVKGPELLDKYVGESEKAVRLVFERARASSPCIVFFDELDSLVPRRGGDGGSGNGVSERVVNQLLTELDGMDSRRSVFCLGATNRPELIDPAMLRPGRLDKLLYVPLPTPDDRVAILRAHAAKGLKVAEDVDWTALGTSPFAAGYSGADCAALLREAGLAALKEDLELTRRGAAASSSLCIATRHFRLAFQSVAPSVSKEDQAHYDRIRKGLARARTGRSFENDAI
jgi:ribosome biogenesis ATPase